MRVLGARVSLKGTWMSDGTEASAREGFEIRRSSSMLGNWRMLSFWRLWLSDTGENSSCIGVRMATIPEGRGCTEDARPGRALKLTGWLLNASCALGGLDVEIVEEHLCQ